MLCDIAAAAAAAAGAEWLVQGMVLLARRWFAYVCQEQVLPIQQALQHAGPVNYMSYNMLCDITAAAARGSWSAQEMVVLACMFICVRLSGTAALDSASSSTRGPC
jgi:hypothetical protein